jgi:hypothetical protein
METVLPGQSRHTVFHNMPLLHIKGLMPLLEMPFLLPKILGLKLGLRDIESRAVVQRTKGFMFAMEF